MIRTRAFTQNHQVRIDVPLTELHAPDIVWYWVDFATPTSAEAQLLSDHFQFHPLSIEDCLHFLQRPKLDHYDGYAFFVLHSLHQADLSVREVDLFLGENFLVSFHNEEISDIDLIIERAKSENEIQLQGSSFVAYMIMDKLVDQYFPALYQIEEQLNEIEDNTKNLPIRKLMDAVFDIRSDLLHLRRTILPMRDLLYRIVSSERFRKYGDQMLYYNDVHDHLIKLSEMVESNRELTVDLRESYLSLNSNRMNEIMKTLTMMTALFLPMTLITGIYGMNFENMPELTWQYGYFMALGSIALVGLVIFLWYRRKGWFS